MFIDRYVTLSFCKSLSLAKTYFEKIYRDEEDVNTKEWQLLVLNVVYQGKISIHVDTNLHRNSVWDMFG